MRSGTLPKTSMAVPLLAVILASTFVLAPAPVFAAVGCGDAITVSTTLASDIGPCPGNGLVISASHIVLDCAGHTITGERTANSLGIEVPFVKGVTVKNCNVTGFEDGLYLYFTINDVFVGNTANDNGNVSRGAGTGLIVFSSNGSKFQGNTMNRNLVVGVEIDLSFNNKFIQNTASGNGFAGVYVVFSSNNLLRGNKANMNGNYGYFDGTAGSGTSGTANVYLRDKCRGDGTGSSPSGLCGP